MMQSPYPNLFRAAFACGIVILLAAPAAPAPARRGRTPAKRRPAASKIVWATRPPQLISLSTGAPEYRGAEARLAQFIRALYAGRRARAAEMLSSKVPQAERQALIEKRWLREDPRNRKDFTQALFMKDLQIRTRVFYQDQVDCYVIPRKTAPKKSANLAGYFKVRMVKEGGTWRVAMRQNGKA